MIFCFIIFFRINPPYILKKSSAEINYCHFSKCIYQENLLLLEDQKSDTFFHLYNSEISNCHIRNDGKSVNFLSNYYHNEIINNTIKFDEGEIKARAFQIQYHRGLRMINNFIKNAEHYDGSAILCEQQGNGDSDLEITNCTFTNCKGENGAAIVIENLDYELEINNLTINYCKNNYSTDKGYLLRIEPSENKKGSNAKNSKLTFSFNNFSYLESSSSNGGGIGLVFGMPKDDVNSENEYCDKYNYDLTFRNTTFEHLQSNYGQCGGGAISFTDSVKVNYHTKLKISGCTFNNVTTKNGGGGAIFFKQDQQLTIEDSYFTATYSNNQVGGSICIELMPSSLDVKINNCKFDLISSTEGGSIYISGYSDTQSNANVDICGCTFNKITSTVKGNSIMIKQSISNAVSIAGCIFQDCGSNQKSFAIRIDSPSIQFSYNTVTFSVSEQSCGCFEIRNVKRLEFTWKFSPKC